MSDDLDAVGGREADGCDWLTGGNIPPGAISHWTAETDEGLRVVDVWESREVFDRFAQEQIGPFTQQVGITEPPEMTYRDVHNHLPHG